MTEKLEKNDFVELEYTGSVKNGEIFDTNIPAEAKKIELEIETRPLIICLGQNQILPAIDAFLIGKDIGKHTLELAPEKAFGFRDRNMVRTMPIKIFLEKQIMPKAGMVFNFDNLIGKVTAVSGGRVIVDFNNPLANKEIVYHINVKRKVQDNKEKVESLMLYFFRRKIDFSIEDKKIKIKAEKNLKKFLELFSSKFKDILGLEFDIEETKEEKPSN